MARFIRASITLISCISLSIVGIAGAAAVTTSHTGSTQTVQVAGGPRDWCC
jgi:hypothetical protein